MRGGRPDVRHALLSEGQVSHRRGSCFRQTSLGPSTNGSPAATYIAARACRFASRFTLVCLGTSLSACASRAPEAVPVVAIARDDAAVLLDKPASSESHSDKPKRFLLEWETDDRAARERAKRQGLPLLLVLGADWSGASLEMRRVVFSDPRLLFRPTPIVACWLDMTNEDDPNVELLAARYAVRAVPTIIVFDADGHEIARTSGYASVDEVLAALRKAEQGHRDSLSVFEQPGYDAQPPRNHAPH